MSKPNASSSRHLSPASATDEQTRPGLQATALGLGSGPSSGEQHLQALLEPDRGLGSKLGCNPAAVGMQIGCQHPMVSLPDACNDWICVECGDLVDRRSPQEAGVPRTLAVTAATTGAR